MPLDRTTSDQVITDGLIAFSQTKWNEASARGDVNKSAYWMLRHLALLNLSVAG